MLPNAKGETSRKGPVSKGPFWWNAAAFINRWSKPDRSHAPGARVPGFFTLGSRNLPRAGFTMIELLLVVVIIILATTIAGVQFGRSMNGAQLRASVRAVIGMNKYARSQAVLSQKHMVLLYDSNLNKLELFTLKRTADAHGGDRFDRFGGGSGSSYQEQEDEETGEVTVDQQNYKSRRLEDKVMIADFEVDIEDLYEEEGVYWVNYYPNGMCDGHRFALQHENGRRAEIKVETITGDLKVDMEQ